MAVRGLLRGGLMVPGRGGVVVAIHPAQSRSSRTGLGLVAAEGVAAAAFSKPNAVVLTCPKEFDGPAI